jgi:uncharacterized NAD(P)/FAD-binding protein YdhS
MKTRSLIQAVGMKHPSVTIIGMGPRGLSILERIAACARGTACRLQVNLVEPNECGPGVHSTRQPQHLLINTLASQVTIFPSRDSVALAPVCATPSLTEWAQAQGYRRFGDQFHQAEPGSGGAEVADTDYLPRHVLGEYLAWAFGAVCAALPGGVSVRHLRHRAFDMHQQPDGSFVVELENGYQVPSDYVFITTGHSRNNLSDEESWYRKFAQDHARYNHKLAFIRHVYPIEKLVGIGSDATVAIQGLGLTAHDVITELTVGRGGRFRPAGEGLRYVRSGREPSLLLFSRNCLPASARGVNQKGLAGRHQSHFFTREAVRQLRTQALRERGTPQLDFERDLLPLLIREMGFAWHSAQAGAAPDPASYETNEAERAAIDAVLFPLRGRSFADPAEFARFFTQMVEEDLQEARRGNLGSPVKACADVLRDVRTVLQDVVEHAGLTPASHRKFLSVYNPAINRVTFGPPRARNEQMLALIESGVLAIAAGPHTAVRIDEERSQFALHTKCTSVAVTQHVDALVIARLDVYSPETDDTPFSRNLLRRGTIRPYYNGTFHPGGLDIDRANHPRGRSGRICTNVWAVGYLAEGANYYTHALPRPQLSSRQVLDADRCVGELFHTLAAGKSAEQRAPAPAVYAQGKARYLAES